MTRRHREITRVDGCVQSSKRCAQLSLCPWFGPFYFSYYLRLQHVEFDNRILYQTRFESNDFDIVARQCFLDPFVERRHALALCLKDRLHRALKLEDFPFVLW